MRLLLIFNLFLTSTYFDNALGLRYADSNSTECRKFVCINKCCPEDFYMKKKQCVPLRNADAELEITLPVYDGYLESIGKTVKDVFVFNANAFADANFKKNSILVRSFGIYITENGILYFKPPNIEQWRLDRDEYCLDLLHSRQGTTTNIWVNFKTRRSEYEEDTASQKILETIISCVILFIVLVVYCLLPEPMNLKYGIIIGYDLSLLLATIFSLVMQITVNTLSRCISLTMTMYFFSLASYCWMNIMSWDIWWTFRGYLNAKPIHRRGEKFKFAMYSLYAWGVPLAMTIGLNVLNTVDMRHMPWFITPGIPQGGCFLEDARKFIYLIGPMMILSVISWLFLLVAVINVCRLSKGTAAINSELTGSPAARRLQRYRLLVYLIITALMTLNTMVKCLDTVLRPLHEIPIDIASLFDLVLGFGILVVCCNKEILMKLVKRFRKSQANPNPESSALKPSI